MTDVKQAVAAAFDYYRGLVEGVADVRLEEVELSGDNCWLITLSARDPSVMFPPTRLYKIFRVSPDGEVLSMKIRQL